MTRLNCYHGSPGVPSDFEILRPHLPGVDVVGVARAGRATGGGFLLGYSWGVNPLLRDLSESTDCRGVIFVSPYLKASPARGAVYFALLGALLAVSPLRWKIARGFLKKTASPAAIPKAYCDLCGSIERGLFEAVREKSVWRHDGLRSLGAMAALPVLLVHGEQDAVDGTAESVALIRGVFPNAEVVAVPAGGHALPWTHTHLIAQSIAGFIIRHGGH